MCGLIIGKAKDSWALNASLKAMSYRGKDHKELKSFGSWAIGHNRLAIQDLSSAGNQPFAKEGYLAAFVGEFFTPNFISEQVFLNDVIVKDFDLLHQVDGFWSFVFVIRDRAYAVTDYLGSKPLYYWPKHKMVCSEITPMFQQLTRPPLDEVYLANCIKWGYDYSGRTPYEGIVQLPPGMMVDIETGGMKQYWDWEKVPVLADLKTGITEAIKNRLIGDREVGLLFSGGLDSSIIYYTLKELNKEIKAFSIENGESEFLPPGVELLTAEKAPSLTEAIDIMQCPVDLGSLLPQIRLSKAVNQAGLNICMTGDGSDEVFGGYRRSMEYDSQGSDVFCELPYYHFPRLDRVMMRETIELRSPFISPGVIAFGLSLSPEDRINKSYLKACYASLLPKEIIERSKVPLKSEQVKTGGIQYRKDLVKEFREYVRSNDQKRI